VTAALRKKAHAAAAEALRSGAYADAIEIARDGVRRFGPHVGLLSEIVHARYHSGNVEHLRLAVSELETEFAAAENSLCPGSRARTLVTLAKYYEELARVGEAFGAIDAALDCLGGSDPYVVIAKAQRLRLLASFGREAEVALLYDYCVGVSENNPDVLIETFHALLLAECRLFGFAIAWERFLSVAAKGSQLQAADLSLCAIDLLEALLELGDAGNVKKVLDWYEANGASPTDAYERELLELARGHLPGPDALLRWTRLTPLARSRLLALSARAQPELRRHFLFLAQAFDYRTRALLATKWPSLLATDEGPTLVLEGAARTARCGGKAVDLRKSPHSWTILATLVERGDLEASELLGPLAKRGDTIQELDSVRINVIRLNRRLATAFGVGWVLRFAKGRVTLNPRLRTGT